MSGRKSVAKGEIKFVEYLRVVARVDNAENASALVNPGEAFGNWKVVEDHVREVCAFASDDGEYFV
ncbi:hypothetical protein VTO73DRAFT_14207 [Trametes versicolor]